MNHFVFPLTNLEELQSTLPRVRENGCVCTCHILTEQKSIMESITQDLLSTDKDETSKEMQAAFPKETEEVKQRNPNLPAGEGRGGKNIMDTPGRHLVYNGDLVEFDVDNMSPIQKVHAFLMNDCLLIANWLPNRRGTVKYKYNALYDLESFAVVNVKDNPPMKDMFKILMFPDSRIFQAENSKIKKEWLEILDETKKNKVTKDRHKKEEEPPTSPARPEVSTNPFDVDDEEPADAEDHVDLSLDWILELPEDLDVCIALRDFEGAVDLLDKLKEYLKDQPVTQRVKELRLKGNERVRQLTEVLVFELSPDRSLRGGPKATRRAVSQLIRLVCSTTLSFLCLFLLKFFLEWACAGQSTKACELFLKNRAAAVHTAIRQLRIEGPRCYLLHKLCNIFFTSVMETAKEFEMNFAGNTGCYSSFVVWSLSAMGMFVDAFSKQVFDSKESLSTAAECVKVAKEHCQQLTEIGVDLTFSLQSLLVKDVKAALLELQASSWKPPAPNSRREMWRRMNLMTPEALAKLKDEMHGCGMSSMEQYTGDGCWVNLSYTVVAFTKQMMSFVEEGLKLYFPELHMVLLESLREIILVAVQHVDYSLRCEQDPEKKAFIVQNASFLHDTVLPVVERRFEEGVGRPAKQLQDLRKSTRPVRINPESTTSLV
ncbi:LOW QUALITY PROTEIN: exocyst complex component 8-like [Takifugu flavidus]|uniref:LOW QUALITY PROTEIN: exocyst complex component 8-like n=1 Tax=Takifugu flavidus TaxID=433684 RepID=UPI002544AF0D|nr:LOW QUALITY PROTEIN: exocyst complex component 8-like [Takifugu flavidus]